MVREKNLAAKAYFVKGIFTDFPEGLLKILRKILPLCLSFFLCINRSFKGVAFEKSRHLVSKISKTWLLSNCAHLQGSHRLLITGFKVNQFSRLYFKAQFPCLPFQAWKCFNVSINFLQQYQLIYENISFTGQVYWEFSTVTSPQRFL